ncbi:FAD-dependent oxidoreductase [Georgenia ruanii]|uniref:Oxidoreductase n=2 Tax=Georgenia ruanii TaxID=348442 RepID=A0A7J9UX64_9MICO|nr:oxidoreductase [Georgenia ruanii]
MALRSAGFAGELVLLGAENHLPYDRPPLSKTVLTQGADPDLALGLEQSGVKVGLGVRATGLDLAARTLLTDAGPEPYDALVLATGAAPVLLPGGGPQLSLRTVEDALRLRERLAPGARVVLIGAGWIGAEVATAALALGCHVTCLEGLETPLAGPLGVEVGARFLPWWHDVDLSLGVRVREVVAEGVLLDDGELVPADVVLTAVGVRPETAWLAGSGLVIGPAGVPVDADRRTSDPNVYAVGDVASRWSDRLGAPVHGGHWDEAASGPTAVAATILGTPRGADEVPYFWSDQFGRKVQYVGQHRPEDTVVLREHADPEKWGAAWLDTEGRITAHLSIGFPRSMVQARAALAERRVIDPETCRDLTQPLAILEDAIKGR